MERKRVPMPYGVESKSYYKYFNRELLPIPDEKKKILKNPFGQPGEGLSIHDRMNLLDMNTAGDEVGIYWLEEGGAVVKNKTFMPHASGKMAEWWFAWHPGHPLRYAIWDPYDHYDIQMSDEDLRKIRNEKLTSSEKIWDVTHYITESFIPGAEAERAKLCFVSPAAFGVTSELAMEAQKKGCSFILCTNLQSLMPDGNPGPPVVAMHTYFDVEGGCVLNSCFWFGYSIQNGIAKYMLPPEIKLPEKPLIDLLEHNFFEYTNLGWLLPRIYPEEKNNW